MGYEIIDQNNFYSPTLNKELNEDLSSINKKSIVLPLGEVKITRSIKSILIIFRTITEIEIFRQVSSISKVVFDRNGRFGYCFGSVNICRNSRNINGKSTPLKI